MGTVWIPVFASGETGKTHNEMCECGAFRRWALRWPLAIEGEDGGVRLGV